MALIAAACAPQGQAPFQVVALALDSEGAYRPQQVALHTVADIVSLDGSVAKLVGGVRVVVDPADPLLGSSGGALTDAQLAEIFTKGKGGPVRASYVEKDGVLWPADFHSWNLVTTYFNFETAFSYFDRLYDGRPSGELLGARVLYFPEFTVKETSAQPLKDNAVFFSPLQSFAVLPFETLQQVPLSINLGVIGHEFSHRVFNKKVLAGQAVPEPLQRWLGLSAATPALNLLKALDEGLADFHAYGVSCATELGCNPRYLSYSLPDSIVEARDISQPDKCLTEGYRNSLLALNVKDFTGQGLEYRVGTVIASALYQAGNKAGKMEVLQKAVLAAYDDPSASSPGLSQLVQENLNSPHNFTLARVADALLSHVSDLGLQRLLCTELLDRLQLDQAELPHCPASATPGTTCPEIAP